MTDLLFRIVVSNVCISLALAIAALLVETTAKRPVIAHLLWVLVLVKLVTPPIVTIPVITIPASPDNAAMVAPSDIDGPLAGTTMKIDASAFDASSAEETPPTIWEQAKPAVLLAWLLGSGFILIWSLVRVYRFDRLLRRGSEVAPPGLREIGATIARRLGLKKIPAIRTTSAQLSPLVWWIGGKVRVVLPQSLLGRIDTQQSQWILAHELAHVRRRDYLVRWLEWLACVVFWWNPLAWWGRQHLRANEEICCDDLVLSSLKPKPRTYANSLLNAIEHFASPVICPPALASKINTGGFLRRRFKMIVSETTHRTHSRWLHVCVLVGAMLVLPLCVVYGQDFEAVEKRLDAAVAEGEINREQADAMMDALRLTVAREGMMQRIREIEAAVKDGHMSREEGARAIAETRRAMEKAARDAERGRKATIEDHFKKLGITPEKLAEIKRLLKEKGALTEKQLEPALGGLLRVVHEIRTEGEDFELNARLQEYFKTRLGLTDEQIELIVRFGHRIARSKVGAR